jgi:pimeloyl-ACP methyl ester carboxylesterase
VTAFVLVHGAWHGGWCYKRTAAALRARGHDAFTPTLTGLADRSHLLTTAITLSTHVTDVVNLLRWEELDDVVLAGHSYGGMVISGVAERAADRLRALVYIDAFVPDDGQCLFDMQAPERRAGLEASAAASGGFMAPIPAEMFGVNAADRAWVDAQCTPQPIATFQEPIKLSGAADRLPKHYFLAEGWGPSRFPAQADKVRGRPGWTVRGFACGHDVMVDLPDELAEALIAAAR